MANSTTIRTPVRFCLAVVALLLSAESSVVRGQAEQSPPAEPRSASTEFNNGKEGSDASSPPDLSNLGETAGGAAGEGSALPTMQGDTTWGGRPAFPNVIAPALVATPTGLPILNDNRNHLVFSGGLQPNLIVDGGSIPATLKSADLVVGTFGLQVGSDSYLPFNAMLLSSPIVGYGMINWAENGSVLPQDRIFFDYRHFDVVGSIEIVNLYGPDPANGHPNNYYHQQEYVPLSVDRYVVGFEKTFGDRLWSLEIRFPFQSQAKATQTFGPDQPLQDGFDIGNIGLAIKRYLVKGENWNITGGMGVQLPTAPATNLTFETVSFLDGTTVSFNLHEILNIKQGNETVWLNPFVGIAYDGHNRLFAQGMFQLCVPLNASSASLTTSVPDGTISDHGTILFDFSQTPLKQTTNIPIAFETLARTNVDFGYWLYQNPSGRVSSVAAIFEVDETTTLGNRFNANVVDLGPQLAVNVGKTEVGSGLLVPVSGDKAYKWEYTLRLNHKF